MKRLFIRGMLGLALVCFFLGWTGAPLKKYRLVPSTARAFTTPETPPSLATPAEFSQQAQKALTTAKNSQKIQDTLPLKDYKTRNTEAPKDAPSSTFGKILMVVAGSILIGILVFSLHNNTWSDSYAKKLKKKKQGAAPDATANRMHEARTQAEDRAASAAYGEAIHILLLQSVSELRRRLDISIAISLTSREILQRVHISDEARRAFATIIGMVEISYFGSHEPSKAEYEICLRAYENLSRSLQHQGPDTHNGPSSGSRPSNDSRPSNGSRPSQGSPA